MYIQADAGQTAHRQWMGLQFIGIKMEKTYSAKLVYRNIYQLAKESTLGGRYFLVMTSALSVFAFLIWVSKKFVYFVSGGHINDTFSGNGIGIIELYLYMIGTLLAFTYLAIFFKWHFKLILKEDSIVDVFPTTRSYTFDEIESLLLASPKYASILVKSKKSNVKRMVAWFGSSEQDWLDFVNFLITKNPSLKEKVFVNTSLWNSVKIKNVLPLDSYKEILALYGNS